MIATPRKKKQPSILEAMSTERNSKLTNPKVITENSLYCRVSVLKYAKYALLIFHDLGTFKIGLSPDFPDPLRPEEVILVHTKRKPFRD